MACHATVQPRSGSAPRRHERRSRADVARSHTEGGWPAHAAHAHGRRCSVFVEWNPRRDGIARRGGAALGRREPAILIRARSRLRGAVRRVLAGRPMRSDGGNGRRGASMGLGNRLRRGQGVSPRRCRWVHRLLGRRAFPLHSALRWDRASMVASHGDAGRRRYGAPDVARSASPPNCGRRGRTHAVAELAGATRLPPRSHTCAFALGPSRPRACDRSAISGAESAAVKVSVGMREERRGRAVAS